MSRHLVTDDRGADMIADSLAASVERFDQLRQQAGLTADQRNVLQAAADAYRALLHQVQAGQLDQGAQPRLVG